MLQSLREGTGLAPYAFTEELLSVLEGTFGLRFPPGTYFQGRGA
jgi:hypothetical protein